MRKAHLISILALILLLVSIPTQAGPARKGGSRKRVLIGFKESVERQSIENRRSLIRKRGGRVRHTYRFLSTVAAELPESQISRLRADPDVAYVEEDGLVYALVEELPWGVDRIDAELVHPYETGAGIKVAVIDTGIDLDHEDLNVVANVTFVDETTSGDDDHGHGTHCAGIIAALDNEIGVIGVAPGALLYAVKVLDVDGSGYLSDVTAGIDWAIENGMQIISLSLGTNFDYQTLRDACDRASAAGILIVAAAGNDYRVRRGTERDTVDYPARYESVIAVGAIDGSDTKAYFSSTGVTLELVAPGVSIHSTDLNSSYTRMTGTSMACPHVVGVAALVLSANPGADVRTVLQSTSTDLGESGWDRWYGYGLVNAAEAVGPPPKPPILTTIEVSPNDEMLFVGEQQQYTAMGKDQYGDPIATGVITWISSNSSVGTIDADGLFTADGPGETTITATGDYGVSGTASVIVIEVPILSEIIVSPSTVTLNIGETQKFTATGIDLYGDPIDTGIITWENNTPTVGTIDQAGFFTALNVGQTTIQATGEGGCTGTAVVTVQEEPAGPEEFSFQGSIAPRAEIRHTLTISEIGMLSVNLTWDGRGDLRLRLYDPEGRMIAQDDSSTWGNPKEEIVIEVSPGDWQIAVKSDNRRRSLNYVIEGSISY